MKMKRIGLRLSFQKVADHTMKRKMDGGHIKEHVATVPQRGSNNCRGNARGRMKTTTTIRTAREVQNNRKWPTEVTEGSPSLR